MTSPLHGEGHRFESGRAHCFSAVFNDISSKIASSVFDEKLPTLQGKLSTGAKVDQFTPTRESTVAIADVASSSRTQLSSGNASMGAGEQTLGNLTLSFTSEELSYYVIRRNIGLVGKSQDRISRAARNFWYATCGMISQKTLGQFLTMTLTKYKSYWSHGKQLAFAKAFLKYLTRIKLDNRYYAFEIFLERPKTLRERKNVTSRIIIKEDIENILASIRKSERDGCISHERALQYTAFVVFGAYTGQRSLATISRLTVEQFRDALRTERPTLRVKALQDKIRMEHDVPLHPRVIDVVRPLLDGRADDEAMFAYNSFNMWIKRQKIPLSRVASHFVLGDLRKFAEQYGDIIQWEQSNRAYILTHGVSGVEWAHYRHPLP
jgi:integrase